MFLQVLLTIEQQAHLDVTSTKVTQQNTLKSCIPYLYLVVCEFKHVVFSTFHILRPCLPPGLKKWNKLLQLLGFV